METKEIQIYKPEINTLIKYFAEDCGIEIYQKRAMYINSLSYESIISANSLAICEYPTEQHKNISTAISAMLIDLQSFCKITNKLTPLETFKIGFDLINSEDFNWLTMDDIVYFTNKIKTGYYGGLYNSLDTIKIFEFLRKYITEKKESILLHDYNERLRIYNEKQAEELKAKQIEHDKQVADYYARLERGEAMPVDEMIETTLKKVSNIGNIKQIN